ncbi:MBL fold metallo-hydrolase [Candidatus Pantoea multigeneris]|uniref:MBL fold metallo-hydrolase n=1 Tax=Candidatus Pantoea multigeneris TaxID=2608357 RepID=A0ABX0R460_9GAMM|nr:MBL fold metallo-hydrolase [Pantoea multigeneris]NIF20196.1 MBL fold metallo-hydrolase [Pantoea multigeneris]
MAWQNPWYDASKSHHTPEGFRNPEPETRQPGDLDRWRKERKAQGLPRPPQQGYEQFIAQWWQQADLSGSDNRIWWLGHAAMLLRVNQRYILIDPALSKRASPVRFAGPQRKTPAPLQIRQLPQLDYVLISHSHYDHLDRPTVRKIVARFPQATFIVPLGLAPWCKRQGIRHVTQLDWWDSTRADGIDFHAVPAKHWSMRTFHDRNRSLWCGWVIVTSTTRFWFSGDSGYSESLYEIPRRLGPFNVAALPNGAYAPKWFMNSQHMDPDQAVKLWRHMAQPLTVPIHWGVFELADESLDEPPEDLARAIAASGEDNGQFSPWRIGESRPLP